MRLFGKPDEAEQHFNEAQPLLGFGLRGMINAIRSGPKSERSYLSDLEQAIKHLQQAVELKPDNKKYRGYLAEARESKKALEDLLAWEAEMRKLSASEPERRLRLYQTVLKSLMEREEEVTFRVKERPKFKVFVLARKNRIDLSFGFENLRGEERGGLEKRLRKLEKGDRKILKSFESVPMGFTKRSKKPNIQEISQLIEWVFLKIYHCSESYTVVVAP